MNQIQGRLVFVGCMCTGFGQAQAIDVLVFSSGDDALDALTEATLEGFGHQVDIGPEYWEANGQDGVFGYQGYQAVLLLTNANWAVGDMPEDRQTVLLDYVNTGGGLVTSEWLVWKHAATRDFQILFDAIPVQSDSTYNAVSPITYAVVEPDPILNNNVDNPFTFTADSFAGTEDEYNPKPGATVYYDSDNLGEGVIGWEYGLEGVLSFSTVMGPNELNDPNYSQLLSNAMHWVAPLCPWDLDGSGDVGILDLLALLAAWGSNPGHPADFNNDGNVGILDLLTRRGGLANWGPCA